MAIKGNEINKRISYSNWNSLLHCRRNLLPSAVMSQQDPKKSSPEEKDNSKISSSSKDGSKKIMVADGSRAPKKAIPAPTPNQERVITILESIHEEIKGVRKLVGKRASNSSSKSSQPLKKSPAICCFCANQHQALFCTIYPDYATRMVKVAELGLCKHCGAPNHSPQRCRHRTRPCLYCSQPHLSALCTLSADEKLEAGTVKTSSE
ncbi:hypothetical protein B9Z55_013383 [Caenorhabditis nigoni]|uniref:Uncharacterized protein n=1 Tax=Caenorhabditis nigoni TaxID=1611254 RepID=A0A2G5U1F9_9PELO|nr:hypothetical protein B9Z55_013383 [Caenorhabditis nigoni]